MGTGPVRRTPFSGLEPLAGPLYLVCLLLVLLPVIDLGTNVWPLRPSDIGWRYGTVGLLSGFTLTPLLGLVMALGLGGLLSHRRTVRLLGILSLVSAVLLVLATALFTLDVIQLRAEVPAEGRTSFWVGAIRAWGKNVIVAGSLGLLWLGASRSARDLNGTGS